jgi:hypothetical protein
MMNKENSIEVPIPTPDISEYIFEGLVWILTQDVHEELETERHVSDGRTHA